MVAERIHEQPLGDLMEQGAACASSLPSFLCSSQESSGAASAARKNQYRGSPRGFGVESERVNHGADAPWLDPCDKHRDEGGVTCATTSGGSVFRTQRAGFRQDESGIALTEALISLPLVLLVFAAFFEFGYAMSQWNQTVKALQYGARLAAVSDSVNPNFDPIAAATPTDPLLVGTAIDPNKEGVTKTWTCSGAGCNAQLNRIVYGSAAANTCQPIGTGRPAMCHINPRITKNNIVVTYERSGLGYWGRPEGAVVTVRFQAAQGAEGITFDLPLLGALLGINKITIPAHPVTITTEDLKTTSCSTC